MINHNTSPVTHTLHEDIHRGIDYIKDHPAPLVLGAVTLAFIAGGNALAAEDKKNNTCIASDEVMTALSGDSLWSMATRLDPEVSPEVTIQHFAIANPQLTEANHVLQAGETISVPICGDDIPKSH